jgi:POT family proton-dependent oligopeptide transporter
MGAALLLSGYLSLIYPSIQSFYLGLSLVLAGNAFFKTAPPSLLAKTILQKHQSADSLFTLYYMAVNVGSFLGMSLIPKLATYYDFTIAFSVCAFGLIATIALILAFNKTTLSIQNTSKKVLLIIIALSLLFTAAIDYAMQSTNIINWLYGIISVIAIILLVKLVRSESLLSKKRLLVVGILMIEALIYFVPNWNTPLRLVFFADNYTNDNIFGFEISHQFFQAMNPFWIFLLSPLLAYWFARLHQQGKDSSITTKFAVGVLFCAIGFLLLPIGYYFKPQAGLVSANWVAISYLCLALGELLVSGLGLAMIARLVNPNAYGFMMGIWYLTTPSAILIGKFLPVTPESIRANLSSNLALSYYAKQFLVLGIIALLVSSLMLIFSEKLISIAALPKASPKAENQATEITGSLSSRLSKSISNYLLALGLIIVVTLSLSTHYISRKMYEDDTNEWLNQFNIVATSFLKSNNQQALVNEVHTLKTTNLFSNFIILNKNQQIITSFGIGQNSMSLPKNSQLQPITDHQEILGYYAYSTNFNNYFSPFLWLVAICLGTVILFYFVFNHLLKLGFKQELNKFGSFITKIEQLTDRIKNTDKIKGISEPNLHASEEEIKINRIFTELVEEINQAHDQIIKKQAEKEQQKEQLYNMARRVAHDLNNYLFGLHESIKNTPNIPDHAREKMNSFIKDIDAMSGQLLSRYKTGTVATSGTNTFSATNQILSALSIAQIKCGTHSINLKTGISENFYPAFVNIDNSEFKRIILNLINNAIEAQPKSNTIIVHLSKHDSKVLIEIIDDGKGIPPEIVSKLGKEELTFGKDNGHGIGVYHANTIINKWGGKLLIQSEENMGTTVSIQLPLTEPAKWFASKISLKGIKRIVITDDDVSIHNRWKRRFAKYNLPIEDLFSPKELQDYLQKNGNLDETLFLVDFQYAGESITGLDLIERCRLHKHCILVTGRSDEKEIFDFCIEQNIRLLPKNDIEFIELT